MTRESDLGIPEPREFNTIEETVGQPCGGCGYFLVRRERVECPGCGTADLGDETKGMVVFDARETENETIKRLVAAIREYVEARNDLHPGYPEEGCPRYSRALEALEDIAEAGA